MIHTGLLNLATIMRAYQLLNTMKGGKLFQEGEKLEQLQEKQDSRMHTNTAILTQIAGGKYRSDRVKSTQKKGHPSGCPYFRLVSVLLIGGIGGAFQSRPGLFRRVSAIIAAGITRLLSALGPALQRRSLLIRAR
jgi:hypothetical protein